MVVPIQFKQICMVALSGTPVWIVTGIAERYRLTGIAERYQMFSSIGVDERDQIRLMSGHAEQGQLRLSPGTLNVTN